MCECEKLTKPPENENITELLRQSSQNKLASDDDFLLYESPKKKLKLTLESIGVSPVNIYTWSCSKQPCFKCKKEIEKGFKGVQGEHFCFI